jgi:hypothetical protein
MPNIKHVGRIKNNKRRAIVAYRTLPGDPYNCLVVLTESLPSDEHDVLIKVVESPAGQDAYELAEVMARSYLPDGRNMLSGFHTTGKLRKVPTNEIEMTPDSKTVISLDKLNEAIAQQRGISLEDLALKPSGQSAESPKVVDEMSLMAAETVNSQITDAVTMPVQPTDPVEMAAQLRSQADAMFKEAKKLREVAETLVPTKKNTKVENSA